VLTGTISAGQTVRLRTGPRLPGNRFRSFLLWTCSRLCKKSYSATKSKLACG